MALLRKTIESRLRLRIGIAVDDYVLFFAIQHSCERKDGKRETPVFGLSGAGMEQNNHEVRNFPTRIQKRDGGLRLRRNAFSGRKCQRTPYQGL